MNIMRILLFTLMCFLVPTISFGQDLEVDNNQIERIAPVITGDTVPFSGTLFSTAAAARLLADLETANQLCSIKCDKEVDIEHARMQYQIDILQASKDAAEERYEASLQIRDDQVAFLESHVIKPGISRDMYFGAGVLSGVALTIGSAYVIHLAINDNQ